ncbi:MAG: HEAT repeat domain-containing protein [Caldilineaceae bacterium]
MSEPVTFFGKSFTEWCHALHDADETVRAGAAWAISAFGPEATAALPALLARLSDRDATVRSSALATLAYIAPTAPEVLPALIQGLHDHEYWVRQTAKEALAQIGPTAVPALTALLQQDAQDARLAAVECLQQMGAAAAAAIPALVALIDHADPALAERALRALGDMGPAAAAQATAPLCILLSTGRPALRSAAAAALGKLGDAGALSPLLHALADEEITVRMAAVAALGEIGLASSAVTATLLMALADKQLTRTAIKALTALGAPAVPALISALAMPNMTTRSSVAEALGAMGAAAADAVLALLAACTDEDWVTRCRSAEALGAIGVATPPVLKMLQTLGMESNGDVREQAVLALGQLGQQTRAVTPSLLTALGDAEAKVRGAAVRALKATAQEPGVTPALVNTLREDLASGVRATAATTLGEAGAPTPTVVAALADALADSDQQVQGAAAHALGALGPAAAEAVPALLALVQGEGHYRNEMARMLSFRAAAAGALGQIGAVTPAVVPALIPALISALHDEEVLVRNSAIFALWRLGPVTPVVVTAVISALHDPSTEVRWPAADALGDFKPVDPAIVPALIATLRDQQWLVRQAAAKALGKLGAAAKAAVPALEALWLDQQVVEAAAQALYAIGPLTAAERAALANPTPAPDGAGTTAAAPLPTLVTQTGANRRITFVALAPDGSKAVSNGDERLILWDVNTGREIRRLDLGARIHFLSLVHFAPNGRHALICAQEQAALWDLATGALVRSFTVEAAISAAAFTPDSNALLLADGNSAILREVASGRALRRLDQEEAPCTVVAISSDGQQIITGADKVVQLWTMTETEAVARLELSAPLACAAFVPGTATLLLATATTILEWEPATGRIIHEFPGHSAPVREILVDPTGQQVLSRGGDVLSWDRATGAILHRAAGRAIGLGAAGPLALAVVGRAMRTIEVRAVATNEVRQRLEGRVAFLTGAAFAPDGQQLVLAGWDGATLWDLSEGRLVRTFRHPPTLTPAHLQASEGRWRQGKLTSVAFTPDGTQLLTGGSDQRAVLWEVESGRIVRIFATEGIVEGVAIAPDGSRALLGCQQYALLVDLATGEEVHRFTGLAAQVRSVAFAPDGKQILTGSVESLLWDVASGAALQRFQPANGASAFAPDGRSVLTGVRNFAVQWNCASGAAHSHFEGRSRGTAMSDEDWQRNRGHEETVGCVAYAPDGQTVLTGSGDGLVILWDVATATVKHHLVGHRATVTGVGFTPDSRRALTVGLDGTAMLWEVATGAQLCTLIPFTNGGWAVVEPTGRFDVDTLTEQAGYGWVFADDPFRVLPPEIFMRHYYEPRLLTRLLAGESFAPVPALGELNRVQPQITTLQVAASDDPTLVTVTVTVAGNQGRFQRGDHTLTMQTGVYDLRLFRAGQLVAQWPAPTDNDYAEDNLAAWRHGSQICAATAAATATFTVRLPHRSGHVPLTFAAYAFNEDRVKSTTVIQPFKPLVGDHATVSKRAYLITVGVNAYANPAWDLSFAANDARRIQAVVGQRLQGYDVIPVALISERGKGQRLRHNRATKANVRNVLTLLASQPVAPSVQRRLPPQLQAATPDDLIILFLSGHGYTDQRGTFYFFLHDSFRQHDDQDPNGGTVTANEFTRALSSTELSHWLRAIDAGAIVMIIDACHAEGAVEPPGFKLGPFGSRGLGQLAFDKGMQVLAASQSEGAAVESALIRQGLLTYALTHDALQPTAATHDRQITLRAWLRYGAERVPQLYRAVRSGQLRHLLPAHLLNNPPKPEIQQPALFDFADRTQNIFLQTDR